MAAHVEARAAAVVEERDLVGVTDPEERSFQGHGVVHPQRPHLAFVEGRSEHVVGHIYE